MQRYGDVAVVPSRNRQRGALAGERRDGAYRITDVWVRRDDGWRLEVRRAQPLG